MQGLSQKLFFNFQSITPFSGLTDYNVNNNEKKYLLSWHDSKCLNFSTCLLEKN